MPKKSDPPEPEPEPEPSKADHDHPHDHKHEHDPHDHEDVKKSLEEIRAHKHDLTDPKEPPAPDKSTKAEIDKPPPEVTAPERKERVGRGLLW